MKTILLTMILLALCGCASTSSKIDTAQLHEVRKGQSTVADIVKKFGRPDLFSKNWDGTQTAAYANKEGRSGIATSLAMMGAVAAGAGADSVIFYFDTGGVLTDHKTTQSAVARSVQTGVAESIQKDTVVPGQPRIVVPALTRSNITPKNDSDSDLPFWLPSKIRDPRQQ